MANLRVAEFHFFTKDYTPRLADAVSVLFANYQVNSYQYSEDTKILRLQLETNSLQSLSFQEAYELMYSIDSSLRGVIISGDVEEYNWDKIRHHVFYCQHGMALEDPAFSLWWHSDEVSDEEKTEDLNGDSDMVFNSEESIDFLNKECHRMQPYLSLFGENDHALIEAEKRRTKTQTL
jgi:hypothetical protein